MYHFILWSLSGKGRSSWLPSLSPLESEHKAIVNKKILVTDYQLFILQWFLLPYQDAKFKKKIRQLKLQPVPLASSTCCPVPIATLDVGLPWKYKFEIYCTVKFLQTLKTRNFKSLRWDSIPNCWKKLFKLWHSLIENRVTEKFKNLKISNISDVIQYIIVEKSSWKK